MIDNNASLQKSQGVPGTELGPDTQLVYSSSGPQQVRTAARPCSGDKNQGSRGREVHPCLRSREGPDLNGTLADVLHFSRSPLTQSNLPDKC